MTIRVDRLRCLVQDCLAKHLYPTAAFYADLLVSTTNYDISDVYLLAQVRINWPHQQQHHHQVLHTQTPCCPAQVYFVSRQYRRAVLLLQKHGSMDELPFRYLAAKALAECGDWEECLELLGDGTADEPDVYVVRAALSTSSGMFHTDRGFEHACSHRHPAPRWYACRR
jgi:anaphase-promoting complex subunit 6